jgi:hypothetical protein
MRIGAPLTWCHHLVFVQRSVSIWSGKSSMVRKGKAAIAALIHISQACSTARARGIRETRAEVDQATTDQFGQ